MIYPITKFPNISPEISTYTIQYQNVTVEKVATDEQIWKHKVNSEEREDLINLMTGVGLEEPSNLRHPAVLWTTELFADI